MDLYLNLVRPLLFRMSAEHAHRLAHMAFRWPLLWRLTGSRMGQKPRLAVELDGLKLINPVGLAAGFDKDCEALPSLMHLGFGYLVPGGILRDVRPGNRRPRLGRITEQEALLNCMGLPSRGREHALRNLRRLGRRRVPVVANVSGISCGEIIDNVDVIQPYVDALEIALTCPNTNDTDHNKELQAIVDIIDGVARVARHPVFVKVPEHFRVAPRDTLEALLDTCSDAGIQGVVAVATRRYKTSQLSTGIGTLSGKPIFQDTLDLVRQIADYSSGRLAVIASGGVFTGQDAYEMLSAGASAVEIYSAMVYRGWMAPMLINRELIDVLDAKGVESVQSLVDQRPCYRRGVAIG